jgi:alpha-L-rhamnosidase
LEDYTDFNFEDYTYLKRQGFSRQGYFRRFKVYPVAFFIWIYLYIRLDEIRSYTFSPYAESNGKLAWGGNFGIDKISILMPLLFISILMTLGLQMPGTQPYRLQCEHLYSPIGIDAPTPRLSWQPGDKGPGGRQVAYTLSVATDSMALVENGSKTIVWNIHKHSAAQLVSYGGEPLKPYTKYYWKVTVQDKSGKNYSSSIAGFETGMIKESNWKGDWITDKKDINIKPAPYFRKAFDIRRRVTGARVYIAAAGLYQLSINGQKIGDHVLDPMYTRFDRRNLYVTYDITKQLQQGKNVIGVLLGNGWYNLQSTAVWYFDKAPWRGRPCFCMDLRLTYNDGSVETISTDKSWKTAFSPIVSNSIYTGEHVDDNLVKKGWDEVDFDDHDWLNAIITSAPSQHIVSQALYPIRDIERLDPVSCTRVNDSDYVYDLGRNIAGVSELTVNGTTGTIFKLKHAEKLYPNGHVDVSNIDMHYRPTDDSDPYATDIYRLNGKGTETFRPLFNYKGFRYVEVTATGPVKLTTGNLAGIVEHSDVPKAGKLSSANTVIDQLWQAANNSYTANLFGYPTDCPQREKNGWTADAALAIETGLFNYDGITIYEKWLADMRDEQQGNGMLPAIIPSSGWGYEHYNTVDWLSALVIIPWELYQFYGDSKPLADNYDAMTRYIDHLDYTHPTWLIPEGLGDREPVRSHADVELTSTAYYYADAVILAKTAKLFHRPADELKYSRLAQKIRNAFNSKFYNSGTHNYGSGFQTENSAALFYGLAPDADRQAIAASLAKSVSADSLHLDVGVLGSKTILNALSENGYAALAYRLATKETYPSWGYWMKSGMTTFPENWNMKSSLNHIFLGEISAWFYKGLGGLIIDEKQPGFKHILLRPHIAAGLDSFYVAHEGPYGLIKSGWKRKGVQIDYSVTIPPNSSASLTLDEGLQTLHRELPPGTYHFKFDVQEINTQPLN